jgi:hypothetical protein
MAFELFSIDEAPEGKARLNVSVVIDEELRVRLIELGISPSKVLAAGLKSASANETSVRRKRKGMPLSKKSDGSTLGSQKSNSIARLPGYENSSRWQWSSKWPGRVPSKDIRQCAETPLLKHDHSLLPRACLCPSKIHYTFRGIDIRGSP